MLLVTGSPGSRTIINTALCMVVNVIDYDMPLDKAVAAARMHHQWFPDELRLERMEEHKDTVKRLELLGHKVLPTKSQGDAHSIWVNPKSVMPKRSLPRIAPCLPPPCSCRRPRGCHPARSGTH